tara:strand:+ start:26 stop:184 length:159 start_codon:yes stop_codon:yes gene_type:complete
MLELQQGDLPLPTTDPDLHTTADPPTQPLKDQTEVAVAALVQCHDQEEDNAL